MKELTISLVCIFLTTNIYGQWSIEENVQLNWSKTTFLDSEGNTANSESFDGSIPNDNNIPTYHFRINIPTKGDLQVNIEDLMVESSTFTSKNELPQKWKFEYIVSQQGSSIFANVSVTPLRSNNDIVEKLTAFTLKVNLKPVFSETKRGPVFKTTSTLAEGDFYKIGLDKTGVFELTGADLKENLSIDIASLDPKKIKIFVGNAGRLAESLLLGRTDDLVETPIELSGADDGVLNENDKIIFFAFGPDHWITDDSDEEIQYTFIKNIYDEKAYVYLQTDGENGLRISENSAPSNPTHTSSDYDFLQIYGDDKVNLLGAYNQTEGTGQIWYSDYFGSTTTQNYTSKFDFSGHNSNENVDIKMSMAARSSTFTKSILSIGSNTIESSFPGTTTSSIESAYARPRTVGDNITIANSPEISIEFTKSNSIDEAWLDYLQIINRRSVGLYGTQTIIQDKRSIDHSVARFEGNISSGFVWNITSPESISFVSTNNGWNYEPKDKLQRFIAFNSTLSPSSYLGKVKNQNLHGIQDVDMIIIHPSEFESEAERLAEHRRQHDGYIVQTVDIDLIYNEFSGGKQDVTAIRDFSKMLHDRSENFKYLLLLGDGSYDHRNLTSVPNHNFVPAYETVESLHPIEGFPTDDFFGLLSDNEGGSLTGDLDIAVGRLPVETIEQAEDIIDKIILYDSGENRFGDWRLRVGFAADDQDGDQHLEQNESLAGFVRTNYPVYNQKKIYFDAFEQLSTPGGDRFPDAAQSINNSIQDGQLILNYLGHGGPNGWAQERVLKLSDIDTWNNKDQLPLLITATCTFTGFDDPEIVSAGEYAMRKKNGGCIALMTTVRAVYSRDNKALADVVFDNLFEKEDQRSLALGDILRLAKNSITSSSTTTNSRKFLLIGDPSMKLALPNDKIVTTHINDTELAASSELDTLKALQTVKISGIITDQEGNLQDNFNGTIYPTVYDKESTVETLANDSGSSKVKFDVFKNIIFKGAATVTNGIWSFEFVVPKDINYQYGLGRISYYADDNSANDASGYFEDLVIGGSSENIVSDDEGPTIDLFMDEETFEDGGDVQKNTTLIVNLSDDLGINVSGNSIGHDLTATLDDGQQYVLNENYKSTINDFKSGQAIYPLYGLSPGLHSITVKAWDVTNNSSEATINFNVVEFIEGNVVSTSIYPNPFHTNATIVFEHDLSGQDVDLAIQIYNTAGQFIFEKSKRISLDGPKSEVPLSTFGSKLDDLPYGLYFYKIKLSSDELSNSVESDFEKFVIVD